MVNRKASMERVAGAAPGSKKLQRSPLQDALERLALETAVHRF